MILTMHLHLYEDPVKDTGTDTVVLLGTLLI